MASTTELVTNSAKDLRETSEKGFQQLTLAQKLAYVKESITIEPVLCLYLIGIVLYGPAVNNLQLMMACKGNAGFNDTVCNAVVTATHAEQNFTNQNSEVQTYISDMISWCLPIQSIVPVLLLLFMGTYSDQQGVRKPFLLLPIFGEVVGVICSIICVLFMNSWPVEATGIALFMSALFGGPSMISMVAFAYIADITTEETRTMRMAMVQMCIYICAPFALPVSGIIFEAIGYIPSLLVPLMLFIFAFLYGFVVVKEPKEQKEPTNKCAMLKDMANPQLAIDTLMLIKKVDKSQRGNIIFSMVIVYIFATVVGGEESVFFFFTQHAYGWDYTSFTYFLSAWTVVASIGLAVGVLILTKVFHMGDILIIAVSMADKAAANVVFITVKSSLGLYIGVVVGILQDVGAGTIRSLATKCVSEEDIGKMQSLLSIVDAVGFALAAQLYHQAIYAYTRDTYVQAFLFPGVGLYLLAIVILLWKHMQQKRQGEKLGKDGTEVKDEKSKL